MAGEVENVVVDHLGIRQVPVQATVVIFDEVEEATGPISGLLDPTVSVSDGSKFGTPLGQAGLCATTWFGPQGWRKALCGAKEPFDGRCRFIRDPVARMRRVVSPNQCRNRVWFKVGDRDVIAVHPLAES